MASPRTNLYCLPHYADQAVGWVQQECVFQDGRKVLELITSANGLLVKYNKDKDLAMKVITHGPSFVLCLFAQLVMFSSFAIHILHIPYSMGEHSMWIIKVSNMLS